MTAGAFIAFAAALVSGAFTVLLLVRWQRTLAHALLTVGIVLLALEAWLIGLSIQERLPQRIRALQEYRLLVCACLPGVWLLLSLCYGRGDARAFVRRGAGLVALAFAVPVGCVLLAPRELIVAIQEATETGERLVVFGWSGVTVTLAQLVGSVLVLMNLESTFRAAVGTMRWRLKFMLLGLGTLFVARAFTTSQTLLYTSSRTSLQLVNCGALLVCVGLMTWSWVRTRVFAVEVYPSRAVLHRSITVLLAGAYLVVIGVLATMVTAWGGATGFPLKSFLVLLALVGLSVLLLSDRVHQHIRRFVSRHFKRPLYDYRKLWMTFTERTTSLLDETELCRAFTQLISETFEVLSVTVWLRDERHERLRFAASTALSETTAARLLDAAGELGTALQAMRAHPEPTDLDDSNQPWCAALKRCQPDVFGKGGHRLCVPLVASGQLAGLMLLGDRVNGVPFSTEDLDLIKCVADQFAASLLNVQLSQRLLQAKELEAFQTMSAFLVHDLKNTASTLSLILQNLQTHFDDPDFRQDAQRAVGKSVQHLNELISRLSALRHKLDVRPVPTDLNALVERTLAGLARGADTTWQTRLTPLPKVLADPDQLQKVLLNLLLNATEAVGKNGRITVETDRRDGWAVVSVSDNGCGISPEFIASSLFRPFRTTKKNGTGIGMFHSKMIVDAHQGRIEVQSQLGVGTTFRVLLPLAPPTA